MLTKKNDVRNGTRKFTQLNTLTRQILMYL